MPTYLDFEKPILELEGKIEELRHLTDHGDVNIAEEVAKLQAKADRLLRQTYGKLTAWQKTQGARHPERPHFTDYVGGLGGDFTPLARGPAFPADLALIAGPGPCRRGGSGDEPRGAARAGTLPAGALLPPGVTARVAPEPVGGAHRAPADTIASLGDAIEAALGELRSQDGPGLRVARRQKFLDMGRHGIN